MGDCADSRELCVFKSTGINDACHIMQDMLRHAITVEESDRERERERKGEREGERNIGTL